MAKKSLFRTVTSCYLQDTIKGGKVLRAQVTERKKRTSTDLSCMMCADVDDLCGKFSTGEASRKRKRRASSSVKVSRQFTGKNIRFQVGITLVISRK